MDSPLIVALLCERSGRHEDRKEHATMPDYYIYLPVKPTYSYFSAKPGCIFVARRAGITEAIMEIAIISAAAPA